MHTTVLEFVKSFLSSFCEKEYYSRIPKYAINDPKLSQVLHVIMDPTTFMANISAN